MCYTMTFSRVREDFGSIISCSVPVLHYEDPTRRRDTRLVRYRLVFTEVEAGSSGLCT